MLLLGSIRNATDTKSHWTLSAFANNVIQNHSKYSLIKLCISNVQNCSWCSFIMLWNSLCLMKCFLQNCRQVCGTSWDNWFVHRGIHFSHKSTIDNAAGERQTMCQVQKNYHTKACREQKRMEALQPFTPRREEDKIITLRRIAQHLSSRYQLYSNPTSTGVHGTTLHRYLWLLWKTCQTTYYLKNVKYINIIACFPFMNDRCRMIGST